MPDAPDLIDPATPQADEATVDEATIEGVRRQRRHIEDLDGEDPLRGGVAD